MREREERDVEQRNAVAAMSPSGQTPQLFDGMPLHELCANTIRTLAIDAVERGSEVQIVLHAQRELLAAGHLERVVSLPKHVMATATQLLTRNL